MPETDQVLGRGDDDDAFTGRQARPKEPGYGLEKEPLIIVELD